MEDFVPAMERESEQIKKMVSGKYTRNEERWGWFVQVVVGLIGLANRYDGKIASLNCTPENLRGEIEVDVNDISEFGSDARSLGGVFSLCDGVDIMVSNHDTILISAVINDIWKKVEA